MNPVEAHVKGRITLPISIAAAAIFLVYCFAAWYRAVHTPFWMDEVLAVTAAQQADSAGVVRAIVAGTDFSPPSFHFLVHGLLALGLPLPVAARLPSIVAVAAAGLCIFWIVRRRFGPGIALVACGVTLASPLFDYAVQARPYGLTTFLLAAGLALWDSLDSPAGRGWVRLIGLWAAMAACISLHFYGILAVAVLLLCEGLHSIHARRIRWAVWAALAAVGPVFLAWMPLARHLRTISAADQTGSGFYGRPTVARLYHGIADLAFGDQAQALLFGGIFAALAVAILLFRPAPARAPAATAETRAPVDANLLIMMVALALLPLMAFALGVVATGSFVPRYALGFVLLPGLVVAVALSAIDRRQAAALLIVPAVLVALLWQVKDDDRAPATLAAIRLVRDDPQAAPVLVGSGLLYIELIGALTPAERQRILFVTGPSGVARADPTNENEVLRLAGFDPRFRAIDFERAMIPGRSAYILRTIPAASDMAFDAAVRRGLIGPLVRETGPAQLYRIETRQAD